MKNKNRMSNLLGLTFLILTFVEGNAQDFSSLKGENQLQFTEQDSEVATFPIDVTDGYNYLKIMVHAEVQHGSLLCEILDPAGKVVRDIKIETSVNAGTYQNYDSRMKGEMQKSFRMPEKGIWKVRLSPQKAVAYVAVEHILAFHPKVDLLELEQIDEALR